MQPVERRTSALCTLVMAAALLAVMASVMVPGLTGEAALRVRADVRAAISAHMADFPPPMPAMSIGDPYYQWSTVVCPTGGYCFAEPAPHKTALAAARVPGES